MGNGTAIGSWQDWVLVWLGLFFGGTLAQAFELIEEPLVLAFVEIISTPWGALAITGFIWFLANVFDELFLREPKPRYAREP